MADFTALRFVSWRVEASLILTSQYPCFPLLLNPLQEDLELFTWLLGPAMAVVKKNPSILEDNCKTLCGIFLCLWEKLQNCLMMVERSSRMRDNRPARQQWSHYLTLIRQLNDISLIFYGPNNYKFSGKLRLLFSASFNYLIRNFCKRGDDFSWVIDYKDILDLGCRRHLVMMLLPQVSADVPLQSWLISRHTLLEDSFNLVSTLNPEVLTSSSMFLEFENEEAVGPGVLKEWLLLVCEQIFNPSNALFSPCPCDRSRFFPSQESRVQPLHLEYFTFAGRIVGLALMHELNLGITFDRVFFLQLAGMSISLEDIQDADPIFYRSCHQILEMDAEIVEGLYLTFVRETGELETRTTVELCAGGTNIKVDGSNRQDYVDLLIQHRFVTSISEQVAQFSKGLTDIIGSSRSKKLFFQFLELKDLDRLLFGSESMICVEDWKTHTEYTGYEEADPQILWFWEGLLMSNDKKIAAILVSDSLLKTLP